MNKLKLLIQRKPFVVINNSMLGRSWRAIIEDAIRKDIARKKELRDQELLRRTTANSAVIRASRGGRSRQQQSSPTNSQATSASHGFSRPPTAANN